MKIRELYALCYRDFWSQERYQRSGWAYEVERYWKRRLEPVFAEAEAEVLSAKQIREWHKSLSEKPTEANRALEVLSRIYRYGEEEELIPQRNPCKLVRAYSEKKRSRVASEDELRRLGKELQKEEAVHYRQVLFCYLLAETGARPRSIARARRSELHAAGKGGVLVFSGKTTEDSGEDESVIIPPHLFRALLLLPERPDGLLLGPVSYERFWRRITRNAGVSGLWLRDLRRAFASVGLSAGVGIDPIGELLNHKSVQTTKGYAKLLPTARLTVAHTISSRMFHLLHK